MEHGLSLLLSNHDINRSSIQFHMATSSASTDVFFQT